MAMHDQDAAGTAHPLRILCALLLLFLLPFAASAVSPSERSALIDLYNSTGGPGWIDSTGWNGPPGTECTWFGVLCFDDSVWQLALPSNNLTGPIPSSIGQLTSLSNLFLPNNHLSGSIPPEIGHLSNLASGLFLQGNELSGSIPPEIGNLPINVLNLGQNQLSGSIPPELWNLANLQLLSLASNQLSGTIPAGISNLSQVWELSLAANQLSGAIPAEIGDMASLLTLQLSINQLSGPIPPELGNLSQLRELHLAGNQLSGTIPASLGNLSQLQGLMLVENHLTGSIPAELGQLAQLQAVDMSFNFLSGAIPAELGNLSNLLFLRMSSNQLTGGIPATLANLTGLVDSSGLDLMFNALASNDPGLTAFLDSKHSFSGWADTQTVPPMDVAVSAPTATSLEVSWAPIAYTSGTGEYAVLCGTSPGGPYSVCATTADKTVSSVTVAGLSPATTYYLVVRTTTFPQPWNPNTVVSELSAEVSGTTQAGGGVRTVGIDIKPGSFPNSIQLKSKGKVPVAVLSDSGFDARQVVPSTVTLAGAPVASTPQGKPMASFEDVNNDGRLDLVLHFSTQALQLAPGAQEAVLEGQTFAAEPVRGVDSVRLVP